MNPQFSRPQNWHNDFRKALISATAKAGSRSKLARALGVNYSTVTDWLRGAVPQDVSLQKLETFLKEG